MSKLYLCWFDHKIDKSILPKRRKYIELTRLVKDINKNFHIAFSSNQLHNAVYGAVVSPLSNRSILLLKLKYNCLIIPLSVDKLTTDIRNHHYTNISEDIIEQSRQWLYDNFIR